MNYQQRYGYQFNEVKPCRGSGKDFLVLGPDFHACPDCWKWWRQPGARIPRHGFRRVRR